MEKTITVDKLVGKVAEYFLQVMKDNDFETFQEMKDCYWWTSADIKTEVASVIKDYDWYLTDDGSEITTLGDIYYSYRGFMGKVYSKIRELSSAKNSKYYLGKE